MRRSLRQGMTFMEILVVIAMLTFGIIPLLHSMFQSTRQTSLSLRQIQASNHAANLLEALRTMGFPALVRMPPLMVQRAGNENTWEIYRADMNLNVPNLEEELPEGDVSIFEEFRSKFFSDPAVVPPIEKVFTRYYRLIQDPAGKYCTIVVRLEWQTGNNQPDGTKAEPRFVELRTLLSNPYQGGG